MKDTIKNSIKKLYTPIILIITLFSSTISYSQNTKDDSALKTEYIIMRIHPEALAIFNNTGTMEKVEWSKKESSWNIEAIKKLEELASKGWHIQAYYKSSTAALEKYILKRAY